MYLSVYPCSRRPAEPKLHARATARDEPAPSEEPTKVAGISGFVRTAEELLRRDPAAAHDMMRSAAALLDRRAQCLAGAAGAKLATVARQFERAAASGDVADLLSAAGLRSHR